MNEGQTWKAIEGPTESGFREQGWILRGDKMITFLRPSPKQSNRTKARVLGLVAVAYVTALAILITSILITR